MARGIVAGFPARDCEVCPGGLVCGRVVWRAPDLVGRVPLGRGCGEPGRNEGVWEERVVSLRPPLIPLFWRFDGDLPVSREDRGDVRGFDEVLVPARGRVDPEDVPERTDGVDPGAAVVPWRLPVDVVESEPRVREVLGRAALRDDCPLLFDDT